MIKILKQGKKPKSKKTIYTVVCPFCGCEFESELLDWTLHDMGLYKLINCPCCSKVLSSKTLDKEHLKEREEEVVDTVYPIGGGIWTTPNTPQAADPCEACPNKDGPKDAMGNPVPGDSMCQWCPHYKWRVTWCNSQLETGSGNFTLKDHDTVSMYDVNPLSKGLYDEVKCPKCGAKHWEMLNTITTLDYHPLIMKDGKVVDTGHSKSTTKVRCLECGEEFEI